MILIYQWRHNREQKINKLVVILAKNSDYTLLHFILLSLYLLTNWFKSSKQAEDLCCSAAVTAAADAELQVQLGGLVHISCYSRLCFVHQTSGTHLLCWRDSERIPFFYLFTCSTDGYFHPWPEEYVLKLGAPRVPTASKRWVSALLPNNSETEGRPVKMQLQNKYIYSVMIYFNSLQKTNSNKLGWIVSST